MMKRGLGATALVGAAGLFAAGCTTSSGFTQYDERAFYSSDTAGNLPYVEIGPVEASTRAGFWRSCDEMVDGVADEIAEQAADMGGNALINVRWINLDDGSESTKPICTTGWGWFALGGIGGFAPWTKGTRAEAVVVFADEEALEGLGVRIQELRQQSREALAEEAEVETGEADNNDDAEVLELGEDTEVDLEAEEGEDGEGGDEE